MSNDIVVGANMGLPSGAPTLKKPPYLIQLAEGNGKTKVVQRFISLDKPDPVNGVVQVKGIFSDKTEEEIVKSFADIINTTPKEQTVEMMFPLHRIYDIRSLIFNAVKTQSQQNKQ